MSVAVVNSRALAGINAPQVSVEVHITRGLPSFSLVGLPELAVKESRDRVRAAIINSKLEFPKHKITVNLAPADLPKEGGRFDLPIALGILAASNQIPIEGLENFEFIGELALTGLLRPIRGSLPTALECGKTKPQKSLILPNANAYEAGLAQSCTVLPAKNLIEVCAHLNHHSTLPCYKNPIHTQPATPHSLDINDVKGQPHAKRALEIAAAGGHNLLMIGPPGTGKSMLASRLPTILPPLEPEEAIESAAVLSISDEGLNIANWKQRQFRAPHHTASAVALVGGGSVPRPGEISLAHNGVLFLDELPEYDRHVLDVLREPAEKGRIIISRAARRAEFPAKFQLIAAMNPCPCGHLGDSNKSCRCTPEQIRRYQARISGPMLDRIDMHINVPHLSQAELRNQNKNTVTSSTEIKNRVYACRQLQLKKYQSPTAFMSAKQIEKHCQLDKASDALLNKAVDNLGLSARAYHRVLKVARTIADLDKADNIQVPHISEAINYRVLDR